jgi:hypothetical protein
MSKLAARERTSIDIGPATPSGPMAGAVASLFVPGLGQLYQRRYVTAALHFASVATYSLTALRLGGRAWLIGAAFFNVWSVVDAFWWSRRAGFGDRDEVV